MPELTCSYCMEGKVEMEALPTACPKCGHGLTKPVTATERFADDPAKMIAGMALEAEQKVLQGKQVPSSIAASIPVFSREGLSWTRDQAAAHVRGNLEHDLGTIALAPTTSESYQSALEFMRKTAALDDGKIELLDEVEFIYQINDSINGKSYKMYLLVFEPVEN